MSATPATTKSLPHKPSEEFLRKEAKRLARDDAMQLAAAQRHLAHQYGYRNWAELMAAVQSMASASGTGPSDPNPSQPAAPPPTSERAPNILPLLPLRGLVAFPHVSYPVFVGRPASIKAVLHAQEQNVPIVMVAQRDAVVSDVSASGMYDVGVVCALVQMLRLPDGTLKAVIEGKRRARISRFIFDQDYSRAEAVEIEEPAAAGPPIEKLIKSVISAFVSKRVSAVAQALSPGAFSVSATTADGASVLADRVASELQMDLALKQALLELLDPVQRLEKLLTYLKASS
jgi:ATP-dependent Lon protease